MRTTDFTNIHTMKAGTYLQSFTPRRHQRTTICSKRVQSGLGWLYTMRLMAQGLFQQGWPQLHSFPKAILFPLHLRRGSGACLTRGCTRLLENS